jgi:hypothetical protein
LKNNQSKKKSSGFVSSGNCLSSKCKVPSSNPVPYPSPKEENNLVKDLIYCLPYYSCVFSSTKLVLKAEQDLPGTEWIDGGRVGEGAW